MDHNQNPPESVGAERHQTLLANRVGILDRDGQRIVQRLFRVREADTVFKEIGARLARIEFNAHAQVCISYAYCQAAVPFPSKTKPSSTPTPPYRMLCLACARTTGLAWKATESPPSAIIL